MSFSTIESLSSTNKNFNDEMIPKFINSEYILLKLIGKGGYSFVYIGYSIKNKKYYAIKILNPEYYEDGKIEEKMIYKLNSINSNYFTKLYNTFNITLNGDYCLCFVFEIMACSVYSLIHNGPYKNGLPFNIVKDIIKQLLTSVNIMHNNKIIHSDIKPENILLCGPNIYIEEIIKFMNNINIEDEYKNIFIMNKKNKIFATSKQIYEKIAIKLYNLLNTNNYKKNNILNDDENDNDNINDKNCSSDSEFTRSLLTSDSEIENNIIEENEQIKYNPEILNNIKIKITDFGGSYFFDKKPSNYTHTIYYSSPETIINYGSNEKIDIWAIGCVTYELLTGEILFEPKRTIKCGIDRNHIYEIQRTIGVIPNYIIHRCKKKDIFFRVDNTQKGIIEFIPNLLINKLQNKLKNYNNDEIEFWHNLILQMLDYDYDKRNSAKDLLILIK
jgi:serine/threonine-protein kinase SRPK3